MDTFLRVNYIRDGSVNGEQEEKEIHRGIKGGSALRSVRRFQLQLKEIIKSRVQL